MPWFHALVPHLISLQERLEGRVGLFEVRWPLKEHGRFSQALGTAPHGQYSCRCGCHTWSHR